MRFCVVPADNLGWERLLWMAYQEKSSEKQQTSRNSGLGQIVAFCKLSGFR
jgi:hypothetical protein